MLLRFMPDEMEQGWTQAENNQNKGDNDDALNNHKNTYIDN